MSEKKRLIMEIVKLEVMDVLCRADNTDNEQNNLVGEIYDIAIKLDILIGI